MQLWIIWSLLGLSLTLCPKETPSLWWGLCLCPLTCLWLSKIHEVFLVFSCILLQIFLLLSIWDFCISDQKFHSYLETAVTGVKLVLVLVVYDLPHVITMILMENYREISIAFKNLGKCCCLATVPCGFAVTECLKQQILQNLLTCKPKSVWPVFDDTSNIGCALCFARASASCRRVMTMRKNTFTGELISGTCLIIFNCWSWSN